MKRIPLIVTLLLPWSSSFAQESQTLDVSNDHAALSAVHTPAFAYEEKLDSIVDYDADGKVVSYRKYLYNEKGQLVKYEDDNGWGSRHFSTYEYDENGRVTKAEDKSDWQYSEYWYFVNYEYTYTEDGSVESDEYRNSSRYHRYDSENGETRNETYDLVDGQWLKREVYCYDQEDKLIYKESYSTENGVSLLTWREECVYSDQTRIGYKDYYYRYNEDNDIIDGGAREESVDEHGNTLYSNYYQWNNGDWIMYDGTKYDYLYDASNHIKRQIDSRYIDGAWKQQTKNEVTRNAKGDVVECITYAFENGSWNVTENASSEIYYNSNGKIVELHWKATRPDDLYIRYVNDEYVEYDTPLEGMITITSVALQ